jgi:acetolactate synthase small subunit
VSFLVKLERSTSTLGRVIGLFAQRDLNLSTLSLVEAGDGQALSIALPAIDPHAVQILSSKIANIIGVESVRTSLDSPLCMPR